MRELLGCFLLVWLAACSVPLKSDLPADQVYRLQPALSTVAKPLPMHLYVPKVEVSPELDNPRIALIKPSNQLDFIANSRWPDNLSGYLHGVVLDAFSRSGCFRSVSNQLLGRDGHYRVVLRVSAFQVEYPSAGKGAAGVEVAIDAALIAVQDQRLVNQQRYVIRKENVPVSTSQIVMALEQALGEAISAMILDWG